MRAQHVDNQRPHVLMLTHMQSDTPFVSHVHAGFPIGARRAGRPMALFLGSRDPLGSQQPGRVSPSNSEE